MSDILIRNNHVVSVVQDEYKWVRTMNTIGTCILWIFAAIFIAETVYTWCNSEQNISSKVLMWAENGQGLLILCYHTIVAIGAILHFNASKKRFPLLADNVYDNNLSYPNSNNYYNTQHLNTPEMKLAWNIAENVFFSRWIMLKGIKEIVIKFILIFFIFILSYTFEHTYIFTALLKLTIPIIWLMKAIVYIYACYLLDKLQNDIRDFWIIERTTKELQTKSLIYALTYESLMAWLNTPVNEKIYHKNRDKINEEFQLYSKIFVKNNVE